MWLTMGRQADRSDERLGASDLAIVTFRQQMLQAVQAFAAGKAAIGTGDTQMPKEICAYQAIVPKTTDWRAHQAAYVWDAGQSVQQLSPAT